MDEIPAHGFMTALPLQWSLVLFCFLFSFPVEAVLGSNGVYAAGIEFIEHKGFFDN